MTKNSTKHILLAPLDWGMGHTTRCIPLARYLINQGHRLTFAGNESQRALFEQVFPGVNAIHLEGYDVRYAKSSQLMMANLMLQIPGVSARIRRENLWLKTIVSSLAVDGVISDNRYGLHHPNVPSVILTHQLHVFSGLGGIIDGRLQKIHYNLLNRFKEVWVPDVQENNGMAGQLSHPFQLPKNCHYIGLLSQFEDPRPKNAGSDNRLLVLLSGLEPQRTLLANALWPIVLNYDGPVDFVAGSNIAARPQNIPNNISYYPLLSATDLAPLLVNAHKVICRSGYSTIMDLARTGNQALLIPTPGQTEQEYLAKFLHQKNYFRTTTQKKLELDSFLSEPHSFQNTPPFDSTSFSVFRLALDRWISLL